MVETNEQWSEGRLVARPDLTVQKEEKTTGLNILLIEGENCGLVYIPRSYNKNTAAALTLMLHGAGGSPEHGISFLQFYADEKNLIIVAPKSADTTWDIIARKRYGEDLRLIDKALSQIFYNYNIDASQVSVGGISDGASYALSLGLANGDLFQKIIAFSPGYFYSLKNAGRPSIFISHGKNDPVLPIEYCSRKIVQQLELAGYTIDYIEFEGKHEIPQEIAEMGANWLLMTNNNEDA